MAQRGRSKASAIVTSLFDWPRSCTSHGPDPSYKIKEMSKIATKYNCSLQVIPLNVVKRRSELSFLFIFFHICLMSRIALIFSSFITFEKVFCVFLRGKHNTLCSLEVKWPCDLRTPPPTRCKKSVSDTLLRYIFKPIRLKNQIIRALKSLGHV